MVTSRKTFAVMAGLATCHLLAATPVLAQSAPFAGFSGAWSGAGTIMLADGSKERLRCRASYRLSSGDKALQQSLRCASDSYKFELSSDVVSEGGAGIGLLDRDLARHQRQPSRPRQRRPDCSRS